MAERGGAQYTSCSTSMGLSGRRSGHATGNTQSSSSRRVPTVRVKYIDSPKIVRTDVANFRSIVQQLTGKKRDHSSENSPTSSYEAAHEGNLIQKSRENVLRTMKSCRIPSFHQQKRACVKPDYYYNINTPSLLANEDDFCIWENEKRSLCVCVQDRFSEQDIIAGLVSGEPLPDVTMLPPLVENIAA